jgi:hypothetical protein
MIVQLKMKIIILPQRKYWPLFLTCIPNPVSPAFNTSFYYGMFVAANEQILIPNFIR